MKLPLMGGVGPAAETSSHLTAPSSGESCANLVQVSLQQRVVCELNSHLRGVPLSDIPKLPGATPRPFTAL